jgi:low affinity Fe/Cu permease
VPPFFVQDASKVTVVIGEILTDGEKSKQASVGLAHAEIKLIKQLIKVMKQSFFFIESDNWVDF